MSPFDWLQIVLGFIYSVRRIVTAGASLFAGKPGPAPPGIAIEELAEGAD